MQKAQDSYKRHYDKGRKGNPAFKVGDEVWLSAINLRLPCPSRKLGPFKVKRIVNPVAFELALPSSYKIHPVFHVSPVKPVVPSPFSGRKQPPPPPVKIDGENEFEVEVIIDCKRTARGRKLDEGVSVSRMNTQLAGLAFLFKLQGQPDVTKEFWVRQALKGYRRAVVKRDSRRPVTFEILRGIGDKLGVVCSSEYEVVLFKVAFVLAFFGAFRIGELVSPSKKVQGGIRLQEVQLDEEGVSIFLRKSKTDQGGRGRMVRIYPIHGSPQCPVGTVRKFLKVRPDFQGPLLVHQKGTWLSRFQFVAVFKKCLQGLGLEEKDFSSHSFRIGAATEAARLGLDVEVIKRIGRWESNRFQSYVRPQLAIKL
ncbi:integrase/recombinase xerD homolog [Aquarana catesbeiana]|uniref:integrase/recombinase xerD homolog n=1 Tax=Aquarana catesbeiana TaxID=8400 RepID=UPI003CC98BF8